MTPPTIAPVTDEDLVGSELLGTTKGLVVGGGVMMLAGVAEMARTSVIAGPELWVVPGPVGPVSTQSPKVGLIRAQAIAPSFQPEADATRVRGVGTGMVVMNVTPFASVVTA